MLSLEPVFVALAGVTAVAWAALSAYVLTVQRRRESARAIKAAVLASIDRYRFLPLEDRLAALEDILAPASRELVMHVAAERELAADLFETLVAYLDRRWTIASLVQDAGRSKSARSRWRRMTALRILARLDHPHAMNLLARAVDDQDGDVAACGLALLGRSRDPRAIDLLVGALGSPQHSASRVSVYLDQSPQHLGARLTALLSDGNPVVRQWAATLLARYPQEPSEGQLAALTRDEDARVRKAAVQTLGRVGGELAAACATQLLGDQASFVRAYAARALGDLGRADHADRVAALLGDRDWWVRLAARESLEMMGTDVWPVLVRCLEHRDKFVRNGAAEVIQNLGLLDSLLVMEAATDNPAGSKIAMLQRIAAAGGVRFTESLVERAGPVVGPRIRRLLDTMGLEHVGAA